MEIGLITAQELPLFRTLLLPSVAEELAQGAPITALGLVDESPDGPVACGAAAGLLQNDMFVLHSLFVAPEWRGRGGGRLLVETLCRLLAGQCEAVELSYTETKPEHQALGQFLASVGFAPETGPAGEDLYGMTVGAVDQLPFFRGRGENPPPQVSPFRQVLRGMLTLAYREAMARGEHYLPVPLTDPSVDAELSMALQDQGKLRSFVVFTHPAPGRISLAWAKSGGAQDLPVLFRAAFARIRAGYPPDTWITVQAVNAASAQLVTALLPGAQSLSHTYVRYLDQEDTTTDGPLSAEGGSH